MIERTAAAHSVTIWVAGDMADVRRICREFCFDVGLCVTVTPTEFIYTGGPETGASVGLVNYPRFPKEPGEITATAMGLAHRLMVGLSQWSVLVQTPEAATWITRRPDGLSGENG